jgi:hypothetical protein
LLFPSLCHNQWQNDETWFKVKGPKFKSAVLLGALRELDCKIRSQLPRCGLSGRYRRLAGISRPIQVNSTRFNCIQPKKQKKTQKRPVRPAGNPHFPLLRKDTWLWSHILTWLWSHILTFNIWIAFLKRRHFDMATVTASFTITSCAFSSCFRARQAFPASLTLASKKIEKRRKNSCLPGARRMRVAKDTESQWRISI